MKFKEGIWGFLKLGIVFALFMFVVSLLFTLLVIPIVLIPTGVMILTGGVIPGFNYFMYIFGVLSCIGGFVVLGWALFYFYKKSTLIYKR
jgi:hypothetical protein